jgi:hypothetical protein
MVGRNLRRNERRRRGVVSLLGLDTCGFSGLATEIITPGACPSCMRDEQSACSEPDRCIINHSMVTARLRGHIVSVKRDGSWRLMLTRAGVEKIEAQRGRYDRRTSPAGA